MPDGHDDRRPALAPHFYKAHGLGNDYLVFEGGSEDEGGSGAPAWRATEAAVEAVCDRWRGVGSDGIVCRPGRDGDVHRLRMFNPDGSEFERSGNGLRVFAAFLAARGEVTDDRAFRVAVGGDEVTMEVLGRGPGGRYDVRIEMGRARVGPGAVEADPEHLTDEGGVRHGRLGVLDVTLVSIGNPHCVHFASRPGVETLREVGPFLTAHRAFPAGVNVQVAQVTDPGRLRVRVWERGVGETSASGTSACAAAVAAVHRELLKPGPVEVVMDGGTLSVEVSPELDVRLRGPVGEICTGRLTDGFLEELGGEERGREERG